MRKQTAIEWFEGSSAVAIDSPYLKLLILGVITALREWQKPIEERRIVREVNGRIVRERYPKQRGRPPLPPEMVAALRYLSSLVGGPANAARALFIYDVHPWGAAGDIDDALRRTAKQISRLPQLT